MFFDLQLPVCLQPFQIVFFKQLHFVINDIRRMADERTVSCIQLAASVVSSAWNNRTYKSADANILRKYFRYDDVQMFFLFRV